MSRKVIVSGVRLAALMMIVAVPVLSTWAGPPDVNTLEARVRELHAKSSDVKVTLLDRTVLRGRIMDVAADSFTIRERKTGRQTAIQYTEVRKVDKIGLSRRTKAILIPAAIGCGVLVVFCAAPYPIGFLCRKDPS